MKREAGNSDPRPLIQRSVNETWKVTTQHCQLVSRPEGPTGRLPWPRAHPEPAYRMSW